MTDKKDDFSGRAFFQSEVFETRKLDRRAPSNRTVEEPAQQVPIHTECDVLVVGGGPAGTAAAVAAARLGADVVLLERYNHLGGLSTGGLHTVAGVSAGLDRSAAHGSSHGGNQEQDNRDEEDDLRDSDRSSGDSAEAKQRRDQRNPAFTGNRRHSRGRHRDLTRTSELTT